MWIKKLLAILLVFVIALSVISCKPAAETPCDQQQTGGETPPDPQGGNEEGNSSENSDMEGLKANLEEYAKFIGKFYDGTYYNAEYVEADEEKREWLETARPVKGINLNVRLLMQIMGHISFGTPRLTLQQAKDIISAANTLGLPRDYTNLYIIKRFNDICGGPDLYGGSGLTYMRYYLNDEGTEYIDAYYSVYYHPAEGGLEYLWK